MKRLLLPALVAGFFVSGCSNQALSVVARETAIFIVRQANLLGIDPFKASPEKLAELHAACLNISALVTLWNVAVPTVDVNTQRYCEGVILAAGPAQPRVATGLPGQSKSLLPPPSHIEAIDNAIPAD